MFIDIIKDLEKIQKNLQQIAYAIVDDELKNKARLAVYYVSDTIYNIQSISRTATSGSLKIKEKQK